jgi:hypothetical protein
MFRVNWSVLITSFGVVKNVSLDIDPGIGERNALRNICFDLRVVWLIAGEHFTEPKRGERFKSDTDSWQCVLLSVGREPNK